VIKKILKKRQKLAKLNEVIDSGASLNIKSVVNEFYLDEKVDILAIILKTLFEPRRKLRPKRKAEKKVVANTLTKCEILIHAIKGQNVPARSTSLAISGAIRNQLYGGQGIGRVTFSPTT
jgi:hypothetical protein